MRLPSLHQARLSQSLLALVLSCAAATAFAQTIFRQVDSEGHVSFSDRRDAPITHHELAPLEGQTGPEAEIRGRTGYASAAYSRSVNQREAIRRLRQAMRERARGPDLQQGIPPVAERLPGERRRERVEALQHMVEAAQARVRELDARDSADAVVSRMDGRLLSASAQR